VAQSAPVAVRPGPPAEANPDVDFKSLFRDVTPLKEGRRAYFPCPPASPHPRRRSPNGECQPPEHQIGWFEPSETLTSFSRSGMQKATLKRLSAGHWPVCAEIDLHGLTRMEAQDHLAVFLHRARPRGHCVRVIHGKGIGSKGDPVLKRMTRAWLSHHPDVLAFCETSGGGALLVLLRRAPE